MGMQYLVPSLAALLYVGMAASPTRAVWRTRKRSDIGGLCVARCGSAQAPLGGPAAALPAAEDERALSQRWAVACCGSSRESKSSNMNAPQLVTSRLRSMQTSTRCRVWCWW